MTQVGSAVAERVGEVPGSVIAERRWRKQMWQGKEQEQATLGKGKSQTNREYLGHCFSEVAVKQRVCDRESETEQQDCYRRSLQGGRDCCALPGH